MNLLRTFLYTLLFLSLNIACAQKPSPEGALAQPALAEWSTSDSLTFTSGIRAVLQDQQGRYWLGSHREGVCMYDGSMFTYFTQKDGLADNQIRTIQEDKAGTIWFGTATGVSSFDGSRITTHSPSTPAALLQMLTWPDALWFAAGDRSGIYRRDGTTLNYLQFPIDEALNSNDSYGVTGISKGPDGQVWIASYGALFNSEGGAIRRIDQLNSVLKNDDYLHLRSVLTDSQGRIWIGNNGIGVVLIEGNSTINISEANGLIDPQSSRNGNPSKPGTLEHVFAIAEDKDGNIWFGDRDTGAWKYDGNSFQNFNIDEQLETQMIWDISQDRNQRLLFAMAGGGVYTFTGKTFDRVF